MQLENKIVLVTGGTEGLGLSLVKKLLQEKCIVHVISRNVEKQQHVAKELNTERLFFHVADVSQFSDIENAVKQIGENRCFNQ